MIENAKILVCVGSGGVGKTSVSAGLGVWLAQQGKKVLVLTIDPSKRLAQTLGIEGTKDIVKVPGQNFKGELYASLIDHKKTFDDFIKKAAERAPSVEKILNNKLYQQLSTSLSGSQEFTSLEKLLTCYESQQFDVIILDTPPTQHAQDFLAAPQKIAQLFSEGISKWLRDPSGKTGGFITGIISFGTKQVFKVLELLTGSSFMSELVDFFENIQNWQAKLEQRTLDVHRLLLNEKTEFCLVTSFDEAKLIEAQNFADQIQSEGYHLNYLVINRSFPDWLKNEDLSGESSAELKSLHQNFIQYYGEKNKLYKTFKDRHNQKLKVIELPEFFNQVQDLKSLDQVAQSLTVELNESTERV